jgi:pilin isopeptide linkage protein
MAGGTVSNNAADENGGGVYILNKGNFIMTSGELSGNTARADGGGVWVSYSNLPSLDVGADAIFSNNRASRAFNRNLIDDAIYFAHIHATHWTSPFTQGYNNFDIAYTNGTPFYFSTNVSLTASKSATGAQLPAGRFAFGVFNELGDIELTASNNADGSVLFPAITFGEPGVFNYTIREITQSGAGWTTDDSVYPVIITVTDNGTGQLVTQVNYPDGAPVFTNTFEPPIVPPVPAEIRIQARKITCGARLRTRMFSFGVFDQNGNEVTEATNDRCGNIAFPIFMIEEPGVYRYTVRESGFYGCGCGWVLDPRQYPIIITVTKNGRQLTADIRYPDGEPIFINHYCPCPCRC